MKKLKKGELQLLSGGAFTKWEAAGVMCGASVLAAGAFLTITTGGLGLLALGSFTWCLGIIQS